MSDSRKWYAVSALFAGAAAFGFGLQVLPSPIGEGVAFAAAMSAGRLMEHLWPLLSDAPKAVAGRAGGTDG